MSDQPQGYAIGTSGLLARRVLTLHQRVIVGSWQRKDGTRGCHYGWYCTYETACVGVPMIGCALVSEKEMTLIKPRVLSFAEFAERKAVA